MQTPMSLWLLDKCSLIYLCGPSNFSDRLDFTSTTQAIVSTSAPVLAFAEAPFSTLEIASMETEVPLAKVSNKLEGFAKNAYIIGFVAAWFVQNLSLYPDTSYNNKIGIKELNNMEVLSSCSFA
ncbi:hypothetical protein ACH5RR_012913 [Cinchona calisaya]|uniref:Uncharacterized protein n=1 Tax=Cinchona calisaya TaxID=153742 RepID=A0ABD3ACN8_9GENT